MKQLIFLLCLGLFLACNSTSPPVEEEEVQEVTQWLTYDGEPDQPNVVLIAGDEEYRSEEALPQMARILSQHHGFNCTVLFSQDPEEPGIADPNYSYNIPGLEALDSADLMIIFTRFRALPDDQMQMIDDYLKTGKPVIGMRTATHAFHFKEEDSTSFRRYGNYYKSEDAWNGGFGRLVLGENWVRHHGQHGNQSTRGVAAPGAEAHPILNGIEAGTIWGPTDVYGIRLPMVEGATPIVLGQTVDRTLEMDETDPRLGLRATDQGLPEPELREIDGEEIEVDQNDPMMPVAWTRTYQLPGGQSGRVFATTMGASVDLLEEGTRRMLVNGVFWSLEKEVPEKANVNLVGSYNPTKFAFHDDAFWDEQHLLIEQLK